MFSVNYRTTPDILTFVAEVFYGGANNLKSGIDPPETCAFPCLSFVESQGRESLDDHIATYFNADEINETVFYVKQLCDNWPPSWGELNPKAVAVVTSYYGQVCSSVCILIENELEFVNP
jgi:hypothetical protein